MTAETSNASFGLNDQDAGCALRVSHMLATYSGEEHIANTQRDDVLFAIHTVVHVHLAIEHGEDFLAIVDMPLVRLVGPMDAGGKAAPSIN